MSKVKILVVDVESGQQVGMYVREFKETNATDAAEEVRDAMDSMTDAEEVYDEDE